jgi:hypothetical protein
LMFREFFCLHYGTNHKTNAKVEGVHLNSRMPKRMRDDQMEICGGPNFNCPILRERIPCIYGHIKHGCRGHASLKFGQ